MALAAMLHQLPSLTNITNITNITILLSITWAAYTLLRHVRARYDQPPKAARPSTPDVEKRHKREYGGTILCTQNLRSVVLC
jgi:hypothetical protein